MAKNFKTLQKKMAPASRKRSQALAAKYRSQAPLDQLGVLAAVNKAQASLANGEGLAVTQDSMRELAEGIRRRARERLSSETKAAR